MVVYQNIGVYHEDAADVEDHTAVHSLDASTVAGEEKEVARHPVVADAQAVFNFLFDDVLLVELVGNRFTVNMNCQSYVVAYDYDSCEERQTPTNCLLLLGRCKLAKLINTTIALYHFDQDFLTFKFTNSSCSYIQQKWKLKHFNQIHVKSKNIESFDLINEFVIEFVTKENTSSKYHE